MHIERELKFSTTEEHVPSLTELRSALGESRLELAQPQIDRHVDSYYDTADGELEAAGWALRVRRRGERSFATLKGAAAREGALHSRKELEVELRAGGAGEPAKSGADWPAEIVAALPDTVDPATLEVQLELHVRRVAVAVTRSGRQVAELAFDEVECRPPGQLESGLALRDAPHFTFNEIEIEATTQDVGMEVLEELADSLGSLLPLTPSATSKLERARVLLGPFLEG